MVITRILRITADITDIIFSNILCIVYGCLTSCGYLCAQKFNWTKGYTDKPQRDKGQRGQTIEGQTLERTNPREDKGQRNPNPRGVHTLERTNPREDKPQRGINPRGGQTLERTNPRGDKPQRIQTLEWTFLGLEGNI